MIGQLFTSVLPLVLFASFINAGLMGRGGPNSLSMTNGSGPPIQQQNSSIIQQMTANAAHSFNNLRLNPSAEGNKNPPTSINAHQSKMLQDKKGKSANKKGVKVGSKVKLQQKLKSGVKSKKLGEKKSKLGLITFYVFLLITLFVPQVPTNVMLRYENHSVPIEQQFVSCQPWTNPVGQKCEFIVEQMAMNKEMPKVSSIWANLDGDNETIQQLGETNTRDCETDGDDGHSYCDTELVISADQIDHLQKLPAENIHKSTVIQIKATGQSFHGRKLLQNAPVCPSGYVLFNYMNACNYPLSVTAASREYPPATTSVAANQQVSVCAQAVMSSGRVWASTDCAVQRHNHLMAETDNASGQTKVKSVCGYYNTPNVCCQNEFSGGPQFCGPNINGSDWTTDQKKAYDAFTAISGNSYAFAFDDGRATMHCNGTTTTAVNIGFCMNP
ncbi:hypothetical protein niasHS_011665 [Heterodera schachtii]|uniref:Uncharacterized protein n=1 Tax=Heterodera schachtii TaxID=97005 RepID=A0ABD2IQD1_HETSC